MAKQISYSKRDFAGLRREQIDLIRKYYPEVVANFNDASIMSVLMDLNAGIADNLHHYIDKALNESFLESAQQKASLYKLAKTLGFKLPTRSASVAVCEFSCVVPVMGDAEDPRYLPIIKAGTQVIGDGQIFELVHDIDFDSNFNLSGNLDRTKVPVFNNNILSAYKITKTGVVINGQTKVLTETFGDSVQPFHKITLPDNNVLSIETVIHKNGTGLAGLPSYDEFTNATDNKWHEVVALAQDRVFMVDKNLPADSFGIARGSYQKVTQRFIKEFTPNGYCQLTFGNATNNSFDILDDFIDGRTIDLRSFLNNTSLGMAPQKNTTMYIKYRVGGGVESNVGIGTMTEFGVEYTNIYGPDVQINQNVLDSLTVINVTPAVGGSDQPSIEEIRHYIAYNFAAQERAVTLQDYRTVALTMPSKFGSPARVGVTQRQNKIEINVLTFDKDNKFDNLASSAMLDNMAQFLSEYRMANDYVVVKPGEIVDLGFEVSVLVEEGSQINVTSKVIKEITDALNPKNMDMGKSLYVGAILRAISNVTGVLSINYIKVFNKLGNGYSSNTVGQTILDVSTGEIDISSGVIMVDQNQILQVRNPNSDIKVIPVISNPRKLI
jgi:hypothetical protein